MYRSLMFKSDPLTQQLQRYHKKIFQTLSVKPTSYRKKLKQQKKVQLQKSNKVSQIRKSNTKNLRYQQFKQVDTIKEAKNQPKKQVNFEHKQKVRFKIHNNPTTKNDNFLNKDKGCQDKNRIQIDKSKFQTIYDNKRIPQTQQSNRVKVNQQTILKGVHNWQKLKKQKTNQIIVNEPQKLSEKLKQKIRKHDPQLHKKLKSTIYESINLGNLLQKIQYNMGSSQYLNTPVHQFSAGFTAEVEAQQKHMTTRTSRLRHMQESRKQSKNENSQNKDFINQFNLKNLIKKRNSLRQYPNQMQESRPLYQPFRTKQQSFSKAKDNQTTIDISTFNDTSDIQKSWMPKTKRKSSVIFINQNGVIREEYSKNQNDEQSSLKMSMKISNLRQMMKPQLLQFN